MDRHFPAPVCNPVLPDDTDPLSDVSSGSLSQPKIQECIAANQTLRPLSAKEKKLLAIVSVMMVLLLISPFIPELKSELIIVAAGILLMLPGIEIVKYDQLAKSEAFTQTIYICCFIGLAGILSSAGVVDVLTEGFQSMMPSRPSVFIVVALLCVLTILLCNFLPAAAVPSVPDCAYDYLLCLCQH